MTATSSPSTKSISSVPRSTYRLQLNAKFSFEAAAEQIAYLAQLGISHCYISPILHAQTGSNHCYDVVDHSRLNPELGSKEQFKNFVLELRKHSMGLILDVVANHMAIGSENIYWADVLENGQSSQYAQYFDIDWLPIKPELADKILLPILGQSYGKILKEEQITLSFDEESGTISLRYFDHLLPLNPSSYPYVLEASIEALRTLLGDESPSLLEFESILNSLKRLPPTNQNHLLLGRNREKRVALSRLSKLCRENEVIKQFVLGNLQKFCRHAGDADGIDRLHNLLERQCYRLAYWRVAADEINYRRFFDVNELAAVRMEEPIVFADTHRLIMELIKDAQIDGLRIDHPDGLLDPAFYLWCLQSQAAAVLNIPFPFPPYTDNIATENLPLYLVVEKILAPYERVKPDWPVHGTVGYDFLNQVNSVFVQSSNEDAFTKLYQSFTGNHLSYEDQVYESKKLILETSLSGELNVLAHRLNRLAESSWYFRDLTLVALRRGLQEVVACFPTYRTYVTPGKVAPQAERYVGWAVNAAKRRNSAVDTTIYDFIFAVVLKKPLEGTDRTFLEGASEFAMKFQQFTAPVMAKSIEDTLFYRYNRLICLNEVGGDPYFFGSTVAAFHYQNRRRLKRYPHSLICTSTHDTKRSEDVRARISVLSEIPKTWEKTVSRWRRMNRYRKTELTSSISPDANDEYLLYQVLVGTLPMHPLAADELPHYRKRIIEYMLKAVREAKAHTSWLRPDDEYERNLVAFIDNILSAERPTAKRMFLNDLLHFHSYVSRAGAVKSIAQVVLKLTSPGVPDFYQGTELWNLTMVDPDNRQPADFALARSYLREMSDILELDSADSSCPEKARKRMAIVARWLNDYCDGRIKLFVTASLLKLREKLPELFSRGSYVPLKTRGPHKDALVCYLREHKGIYVIVVAPRLVYSLMDKDGLAFAPAILGSKDWQHTIVQFPGNISGRRLQNLFTHQLVIPRNGELSAVELLKNFPACVLTSN